ncbi:cobalamin-dependent protein [Clostridium sp. ZS2-4]|uniref:cobalamin-dependent protein n=1 Tax=Clostridium sp. ZS2-4 TaxID=2987703 RepID=UPI00227BFA80|nr:cobalamin-dependent protein [Clostridium sp. ZS2-4]MCY6356199.1 cobalamin-dependent protein [Clostridium sp. ZS2-4]
MKKIVLINPPNDMNKKNNFSNGLFSLGTILKKEGYSVRIIDFGYLIKASLIKETSDSNINIDIMCNYILNENPNVVSFYTMSNSYYLTIKLSKRLKEKNSKIKVIFGGPQATLTSDDTLKICPWIDAIGLGEGEKSISNIIYNLLNFRTLKKLVSL